VAERGAARLLGQAHAGDDRVLVDGDHAIAATGSSPLAGSAGIRRDATGPVEPHNPAAGVRRGSTSGPGPYTGMMVGVPVRLLIADDNDAYRDGMVRAADRHLEIDLVAEADGGVDAITAIVRHRPDVALVDLRMPGVDGFEVCRRLAATVPHVAVSVVILSAATEAGLRDEALAAGAVAFLTKDLPRNDILRHVVALARRAVA
jgi:CheY-like chemotaxis protein